MLIICNTEHSLVSLLSQQLPSSISPFSMKVPLLLQFPPQNSKKVSLNIRHCSYAISHIAHSVINALDLLILIENNFNFGWASAIRVVR